MYNTLQIISRAVYNLQTAWQFIEKSLNSKKVLLNCITSHLGNY